MKSVLIRNAGKVVSGRFEKPFADGDSIYITDGVVEEIGWNISKKADGVIDVNQMTVVPGLFDSHVHPVFGDFTPRQNTLGFIESSVHGGVTTFISAGEVHLPGRPRGDKEAAKALAILAHKSFKNFRPLGAKIHAGALLLEKGLVEKDFEDVVKAGVWLVGEVGLGSVQDPDEAAELVHTAQKHGMKVVIHTGGASIPGSTVINADVVLKVRPDVVSHINGGPTSPSAQDIRRIIENTASAVEVVQCGNFRSILETVKILHSRNELHRLIIGNDSPSGTGVIPLGIIRTISFIASNTDVAAEKVVCTATGNTGKVFGLKEGILEPGRPADLVVIDAPYGSVAKDALEAFSIGDIPGVAMVMVDGVPRVGRSRMTPPPSRQVKTEGDAKLPEGGH
ncbi:MAG: amidohydrolase family protein [Candidatus Caldarchaeum sp.]|nr:amidohydrolase family protein [Candidatus Caldarchaeum sp.]MCS7137490.1 amidohydrolase family protein [Candidatus Caldarchaeum sp.]MDW7978299.1 amidohydrolase family protein [Candidatus Caldarchaeum sp.]MDW8359471.1 amidohydrolase family protein [Candidatus Caldarchaeum sp.]